MCAGDLDTTFNYPKGYVIEPSTLTKSTYGYSAAIDSFGRIIVTGITYKREFDPNVLNIPSMFLTRYLPDGTLDTSFAGGVIIKNFEKDTYSNKAAMGSSVAIDSINRVIVTGSSGNNMFIARYLEDGKLDPRFAGGFILKNYTPTPDGGTTVNSVTIDSSDRIIVTGVTGNLEISNTSSVFISRYLIDGTLDTSFAGGVIIKNYIPDKQSVGSSVAIDRFGRILVAGFTNYPFFGEKDTKIFITRYLPNGKLDTNFAGGVIIPENKPG
jgi:uncharacterized delta-60 repeat protein